MNHLSNSVIAISPIKCPIYNNGKAIYGVRYHKVTKCNRFPLLYASFATILCHSRLFYFFFLAIFFSQSHSLCSFLPLSLDFFLLNCLSHFPSLFLSLFLALYIHMYKYLSLCIQWNNNWFITKVSRMKASFCEILCICRARSFIFKYWLVRTSNQKAVNLITKCVYCVRCAIYFVLCVVGVVNSIRICFNMYGSLLCYCCFFYCSILLLYSEMVRYLYSFSNMGKIPDEKVKPICVLCEWKQQKKVKRLTNKVQNSLIPKIEREREFWNVLTVEQRLFIYSHTWNTPALRYFVNNSTECLKWKL